ncbi:MAG: DUF3644 domain-containing protein [Alphaproteobacteria bacterium]
MAKSGRGSLTPEEARVAKALLAKGWHNQDIQALVNFGRKGTVNSGRITGVKQGKTIEPAEPAAVEFFIRKKKAYDPRTGLNLFDDERLIRAREAMGSVPRPRSPRAPERLIRAREAMALAVQIFNSPTLNFKTEVFAVLANIAWTYLLHEFYLRKSVKIINEDGNTLLLSQMLKRADCPLSSGTKKNLESIKIIRDTVEHTLLGKSDYKWLTLFQACCLNFDKVMRELFGEELSLQNDLAIALQFAQLTLDQLAAVQKYDVPDHIEALDARLKKGMSEEELNDLEYQFRVVYTLDSASKTEAHFHFISPGSEEGKQIHNILVKYKSADETHPYKPNQVVLIVAKRSGKKFTNRNHTQAWRKFPVRPKAGDKHPEATTKSFCVYHPAHKDYTYSEEWINFLVNQISTDEGFANIKLQKI